MLRGSYSANGRRGTLWAVRRVLSTPERIAQSDPNWYKTIHKLFASIYDPFGLRRVQNYLTNSCKPSYCTDHVKSVKLLQAFFSLEISNPMFQDEQLESILMNYEKKKPIAL